MSENYKVNHYCAAYFLVTSKHIYILKSELFFKNENIEEELLELIYFI